MAWWTHSAPVAHHAERQDVPDACDESRGQRAKGLQVEGAVADVVAYLDGGVELTDVLQ